MSAPAGNVYVSTRGAGAVTVLTAHGLVNPACAVELRSRLNQAIGHAESRIVIDVEDLEVVDMAGIRVLLAVLRTARAMRKELVLAEVPPAMVDVLRENGLHRVLPCFRSLDGALQRLKRQVS
jgi:anti-anti-sigma factor